MEKEVCEKCLGRFATVIAQLVHAEEFALHDETERALRRVDWALSNKQIMETKCLAGPESKLFDNRLSDLRDAIATKNKYKIAELTTDTASHLHRALTTRVCRTELE